MASHHIYWLVLRWMQVIVQVNPFLTTSTLAELVVHQGDNMERESKVQQTKTEEVEEEGKPSESIVEESFQRTQENGRGGNRGGILGAIAETIAEIAQQTKELIIGQHKTWVWTQMRRKQEQHENDEGTQWKPK